MDERVDSASRRAAPAPSDERAAIAASGLFDATFYAQTYFRGTAVRPQTDLLAHYVTLGHARRYMPSPLFDLDWIERQIGPFATSATPLFQYLTSEAKATVSTHPLLDARWYLENYPEASLHPAGLLGHCLDMSDGEIRSGNPLFDAHYYLSTNEDVRAAGIHPLSHYCGHGEAEGRCPNVAFDLAWYRKTYAVDGSGADGPLAHFLTRGAAGGARISPCFDARWYRWRHCPGVADEFEAIRHYCLEGRAKGLVPLAGFDRDWYRASNPDLPANADPFVHFDRYGAAEGRFGFPGAARISDLAGDPDVARRVQQLVFRHRLCLDRDGRVVVPPKPVEIETWRDEIAAALADRPEADAPAASIVVSVKDNLPYTMACLSSLLAWPAESAFEVLVADDGSTDGTLEALAGFEPAIRIVPNAGPAGFIGNNNNAAGEARGQVVVFLNNDTLVLPGWLDELLATFALDPRIAVVGSRLLFPDGLLQEAGGIVWRDGSAWNYGRGEDPRAPEYSYLRDADYASGAALAVRRDAWEDLGGFDTYYDTAYAEDSDLCMRARAAGYRVVVQPHASVIHFEGVSHGTDTAAGVKAFQLVNQKRFSARWRTALLAHEAPGERVEYARDRQAAGRVLVIDAVTPAPEEDAGSVTCLEIMRAMLDLGYKVTFIPGDNFLWDRGLTAAIQRIGIEAIYHPYYSSVPSYLEKYGETFDFVLVFRCDMASRFYPAVFEGARQARIIFHNSDMHTLRLKRFLSMKQTPEPGDLQELRSVYAREMAAIAGSAVTIVHSSHERELLNALAPTENIFLFPWIYRARETVPGFGERSHMAFLGGYRHPPNVDAVEHFCGAIWPLVARGLPDAQFHIVGANAPESLRRLARGRVRMIGFVKDLADCFDHLRVSVVPLRYGAGIKGKVITSMAYGVPVVSTACGVEGMGLVDGENVLVRDDPEGFAEAVVRLYTDPDLWRSLSAAGIAYVEENFGVEQGRERVRQILEIARSDGIDRILC